MKKPRSIPEPFPTDNPKLYEYLEQVRALLIDMDQGGKRRFVSVEELEEAGIARLINGRLVKL